MGSAPRPHLCPAVASAKGQAGVGRVHRQEARSPESGQNLLGSGRLRPAATGESLGVNRPLWGKVPGQAPP